MFKTTALNNVANEYVDKDDGTSTPGTRLEADDRNIVQDELVNAVEGLFLTLDPTGVLKNQLLTGILPTYSALKDYPVGWIVQGSDNISYTCKIVNGPSSSVVSPIADTTGRWVYSEKQIEHIGASVGSSALTITLQPTELDFRDSDLDDGTINKRRIVTELSLVISSGSTLGTISATQSRIIIIAIDNAGTIELAAVNVAGGNNLDETTLNREQQQSTL